MRVLITGATGFIGQALCRHLYGDYELVALSRDARKGEATLGHYARIVEWDGRTSGRWASELAGARAVVNLAGENVGAERWSRSKKASIRQSRIHGTRALLDAIAGVKDKPAVLVQGSAIGYYGSCGDEVLTENSPAGTGYLAGVCRDVEALAGEACEGLGVRCALARTGVVLGTAGGALPKLAKPFRFYLGGHPGNGRQWFSWISLRDEIRAIRFLIEHDACPGAYNLTAPEPVTMKAFCQALGNVLNRPSWTSVPAAALRLAFGEMADEVLLASQCVLPKRLTNDGFDFLDANAPDALAVAIRGEEHGST